MVDGPGTHPPGWVQCRGARMTPDASRTANHEDFYFARIVCERSLRIMRAYWKPLWSAVRDGSGAAGAP